MNIKMQKCLHRSILSFINDKEEWVSSLCGTHTVYKFEQKFTKLLGKKYALSVSNATQGLWAVLMAYEIKNAQVIITPYTWGGSITGVLLTQNEPVFADIDKDSLTLEPDKVRSLINSKTKAILAVDIYGNPCNGIALRKVADEFGLVFIQDCAQSFGTLIDNLHTGYWANASVFSLTYGKHLFTGEGGIIVTDDEDLYNRLIWNTQHLYRQYRDIPTWIPNEFFINMRINPLSAVWGNAIFELTLSGIKVQQQKYLKIFTKLYNNDLIYSKPFFSNRIKPSFWKFTFEPKAGLPEIERYVQSNFGSCLTKRPPIVKTIYQQQRFKEIAVQKNLSKSNCCPIAENQCKRRIELVCDKDLT